VAASSTPGVFVTVTPRAVHAATFDVVDPLIDVGAGAVELGGVDVDDQRDALEGGDLQAGGEGHPVVGVHDVEGFVTRNLGGERGVPLDLGKKVTRVLAAGRHRDHQVPRRGNLLRGPRGVRHQRPIDDALARALDLAARFARGPDQRLPTSGRAQHDPRLGGPGQLRQKLRHDVADGLQIEGSAKRLPERDEPFELRGARIREPRFGFGRGGLRLGFLPLPLLMEHEDDGQDRSRTQVVGRVGVGVHGRAA